MGAETGLVSLEDVSAHDLALSLGDVSISVGPKPVRQCLLTGHVRIEDIRVAGCDNSVEDIPDGIVIGLVCRSNQGGVGKSPNSRVEPPAAAPKGARTAQNEWRAGCALKCSVSSSARTRSKGSKEHLLISTLYGMYKVSSATPVRCHSIRRSKPPTVTLHFFPMDRLKFALSSAMRAKSSLRYLSGFTMLSPTSPVGSISVRPINLACLMKALKSEIRFFVSSLSVRVTFTYMFTTLVSDRF